VTPFRGQKVSRPINAETENVPYLGNAKAYELGTRMDTMIRVTDVRGDLKGQRSWL